jgi:F0F1-type ATP synthase epsilon subunit
MEFKLAVPESQFSLSEIETVNAQLANGDIQILEFHQDLMAKIECGTVSIKPKSSEELIFVVQNAAFIVSSEPTKVTLFAEKAVQIKPTLFSYNERFSIEKEYFFKQYEEKKVLLEKEKNKNEAFSTKVFLLKKENEFLEKLLVSIEKEK